MNIAKYKIEFVQYKRSNFYPLTSKEVKLRGNAYKIGGNLNILYDVMQSVKANMFSTGITQTTYDNFISNYKYIWRKEEA